MNQPPLGSGRGGRRKDLDGRIVLEAQRGTQVIPPQRPHTDRQHPQNRSNQREIVPTGPAHESHASTRRPRENRNYDGALMIRLVLIAVATVTAWGASSNLEAAPKKKYHFKLAAVTAKPEVKADENEKDEEERDAKREKAEREAVAAETARMTRDYFRVEDTDGHRFWIYREGLYRKDAAPRWYLQGVSA